MTSDEKLEKRKALSRGVKALRKAIIWVICILIFMILLLSTVGMYYLYDMCGFLQHIDYSTVKDSSDYGVVSTEQDLIEGDKKTHIYEVRVENPKAVVLYLSGIQQPSVTYFYSHSKMLQDNGYASILIDVQGHGKSSGDRIDFGVTEIRDVQRTIDYIKEQEVYAEVPIVVQGVSMGGAIAVTSASFIEDIDGLIAMSAFSSWTDVCIQDAGLYGVPEGVGKFLTPVINLNGLITYGTDYIKYSPKNAIRQLGNKPALFIHSYGDTTVPIRNLYELLDRHVGSETHVWVRASKEHLIVQGNKIAEPYDDVVYCDNILSFLNKYFGEKE